MLGVVAVLQPKLVLVVDHLVVLLPRGRQLGYPRVALLRRHAAGERFEEHFLVADDSKIERPVSSQVFLNRVDSNRLYVRVEAKLARTRHAVLAHEDHQIGAH